MKERERGFCIAEQTLYYPIARSQPLFVSLSLFLSPSPLPPAQWSGLQQASHYLMPSLKISACVEGSSLT